MKIRLGASLAVAAFVLCGAEAQAGLGGLAGLGSSPCADGDTQANFSACNTHVRATYKLVYDTVLEKRFHVCYQTVQETVMTPVTKTCYRDEYKTCYKPCQQTEYKTVQARISAETAKATAVTNMLSH